MFLGDRSQELLRRRPEGHPDVIEADGFCL
jgi:hypothetical protein